MLYGDDGFDLVGDIRLLRRLGFLLVSKLISKLTFSLSLIGIDGIDRSYTFNKNVIANINTIRVNNNL